MTHRSLRKLFGVVSWPRNTPNKLRKSKSSFHDFCSQILPEFLGPRNSYLRSGIFPGIEFRVRSCACVVLFCVHCFYYGMSFLLLPYSLCCLWGVRLGMGWLGALWGSFWCVKLDILSLCYYVSTFCCCMPVLSSVWDCNGGIGVNGGGASLCCAGGCLRVVDARC